MNFPNSLLLLVIYEYPDPDKEVLGITVELEPRNEGDWAKRFDAIKAKPGKYIPPRTLKTHDYRFMVPGIPGNDN